MLCYPNAKINLGLNITERRPDGYHNLETVFYPIPVCDTLNVEIERILPPDGTFSNPDRLRISSNDDFLLCTGGIDVECPAEKNLVVKALYNLKQDFDLPRAYIYMNKQIPSGAGLGGGSSDAAYAMKCLNELYRLGLDDEEMEKRVSTLGADCAFFIRNRPVFATGIGNEFTPIELSLTGWTLILIKPNVFVSTKDAYAQIHPHQPEIPVKDIVKRPVEEWKNILVNDFEEGIFALYPEIGNIKDRLYELGATYASMSGSGSSVFGLFRKPQDDTQMEALFSNCFYRQCLL